MAYMSEAGGLAGRGLESAAFHERERRNAAAQAIREAERILAETEAGDDVEWAHPCYSRPTMSLGWGWSQPTSGAALADALAAILPVLDELALESAWAAQNDVPDTGNPSEDAWHFNLHGMICDRNRATLAAMGAGGR